MDEDLKEIKRLLEENAEAIDQVQLELEKIRSYFKIRIFITIIWIIAVTAPAVLAFIYLPSFISDHLGTIKALF